MNSGRPLFVQEIIPDSAEDGDRGDAAAEKQEPETPRGRPDSLGNRLKFSENYAENPHVPGQARLYPDTVKVVSERYRTFLVSDEADMQLYSEIKLSDAAGGHFRITSTELQQWDAERGTWCILLRYQERMFKTTRTSATNPDAP